jgi:hypothetical protein
MFENDYTFVGKHATYIKFLANKDKKEKSDDGEINVKGAELYDRYIDVMMNGAVFGLLYNRRGQRDTESKDRARVYADAFANCREDCMFLYRLVMLLDKSAELSEEQVIDRAFRDDADGADSDKFKTNLDLFYSYVLGGIEVMFESLTDGCTTDLDYIDRAFEKMKSFREELQGTPYESRISELISS